MTHNSDIYTANINYKNFLKFLKITLCVFLFLSIVFASAINLYPYLGFDSASFQYIGKIISNGGTPYISFVDNKFPGIYYLFAFANLFSSWSPLPALILFRIIDIGILSALYFLLMKYVSNATFRLLALAAFWVAYTNTFMSTFETTYAEMPEVLMLICSYIILLKNGSAFFFGLMLGFATLFRQPAILHGILIFTFIFNPDSKLKTSSKQKLHIFQLALVGGLTPFLILLIVGFAQGYLSAFWQQTIIWPYRYLTSYQPFLLRIPDILSNLYQNEFMLPLGVGLLIWLISALVDFRQKLTNFYSTHFFIMTLVVAGLMEASLTGELWRHQLIPWLPSLTLAFAFGIERINSLFEDRPRYSFLLILIIFASLIRPSVSIAKESYGRLYHFNEREASIFIGKWVKARTQPSEKVFVWGFAPQIYLESERYSNSAQFHNLLLTNLSGSFTANQNELILQLQEDFIKEKPHFIFLLSPLEINNYLPGLASEYNIGILQSPYGNFNYLENLNVKSQEIK